MIPEFGGKYKFGNSGEIGLTQQCDRAGGEQATILVGYLVFRLI